MAKIGTGYCTFPHGTSVKVFYSDLVPILSKFGLKLECFTVLLYFLRRNSVNTFYSNPVLFWPKLQNFGFGPHLTVVRY